MLNDHKYLALPSPEHSGLPAPAERVAFYQTQGQDQDGEASSIPIAHYLWMLSRHKWRLLLFVSIAVASTIIVSSRLTPYYESTATIDVDRMAPNAVIGQEANATRAMSGNDSDIYLSTQVSLLKSDSVIRPVVEKFKLRLATPKPGVLRDPLADETPVSLPYLTVTRPPKTYLLQVAF